MVRVRHHHQGKLARVEVPAEQICRLCEEPLRSQVIAALKEVGYTYVAVDLAGFRSGSLNEVLDLGDRAL